MVDLQCYPIRIDDASPFGAPQCSQLVEGAIQQVLESQVSDHLSADRYERTDERAGYRNGYRERQLYTRVGPITLRVPQTREGSFSSDIFSRYCFQQRADRVVFDRREQGRRYEADHARLTFK